MSAATNAPLLQTRQLSKRYRAPQGGDIEIFAGLDFEVMPGEMVAIVGQSGCGKSTLLHLLGLLDRPDGGEVWIGGTRADPLPDTARARFRNANLGFVFQFHHLLKEFSALENVMMPLVIEGRSLDEARPHAARMLEAVGLGARATHRPGELSGGEQQRVAIARALVHRPRLLLADEPTGNLDESTAETIHNLLLDLNRREGITTVVVTHNRAFASRMPRVLQLHLGRLEPADEGWRTRPAVPGAM